MRITDDNRRWWVLGTMTGCLSMLMLDSTVVGVALPVMGRDLGVSTTGVQWIVNAYLLSLAALVAVGGRLADLLGAERTFRIGAMVFVIASAACGLAPNEAGIIVARAVQGAGAALMAPATSAILMRVFGPEERGRAMGIYAGISMIFLALGPLVGGTLTDAVSWRAVFFVNLPVGAVMLALARVTLPRGAAPDRTQGGMDWIGVPLLVGALGALVLGLMQGSVWGWGSPVILGLLALSVVLAPAFVVWERRQARPLVEFGLLRAGSFAVVGAVLASVQFALAGVSIFGAIWVQTVLGFSPIRAGLSLLPLTVSLLITAPLAGRLYDRIGARVPLAAGGLLLAAGMGSMAAVMTRQRYGLIVPGYLAMGVGLGLTISPGSTDAMAAAPAHLRGQAAGLVQTLRQVGGTIGIAVLGAIVLHVERTGSPSEAISAAYWAAAGLLLLAAVAAALLIHPRGTVATASRPSSLEAPA